MELDQEISNAGCITFWYGEQKVRFSLIFDTLHHCPVEEVCHYSQCDRAINANTRDSHEGCVPAAICSQKEIGHCLSMLQGEEMKQVAD